MVTSGSMLLYEFWDARRQRGVLLRILVVGAGSCGSRHAKNAIALGHQVCVADPVEYDRDGVNNHPSLADALEWHGSHQIDAAIIASPSHLHYEHARACLEAGLPVAVEKPLCLDPEQARELVALAERQGVIGSMLQSYRYNTGILALKSLLATEPLATPYYALYDSGQNLYEMYPGRDHKDLYAANKDMGGGVHWVNLSHLLDTVRFLFGEINQINRGCVLYDGDGGLDTGVLFTMGAGGTAVVAISDMLTPFRKHRIDVITPGGNCGVDLTSNRGCAQIVGGLRHHYEWDAGDPYLEELKAFLAAVEQGGPSPVPLSEGARVVELIAGMIGNA